MTLPEVVIYKDKNFQGDSFRTNIKEFKSMPPGWNDLVSSIVVVSGTWQFFSDSNYGGTRSGELPPGYYPWVEDMPVNMKNDHISSFKCINVNPI